MRYADVDQLLSVGVTQAPGAGSVVAGLAVIWTLSEAASVVVIILSAVGHGFSPVVHRRRTHPISMCDFLLLVETVWFKF